MGDHLEVSLGIFAAIFFPVAMLIGLSSAIIGFSAWNLVVPLCFVGLGYDIFDSVFMSMFVDLIDAIILTILYQRQNLVNTKHGIFLGIISAITAVVVNVTVSKPFLHQHSSLLKGSVPYVILVFAVGFLIKGFREQKSMKNASFPPAKISKAADSETTVAANAAAPVAAAAGQSHRNGSHEPLLKHHSQASHHDASSSTYGSTSMPMRSPVETGMNDELMHQKNSQPQPLSFASPPSDDSYEALQDTLIDGRSTSLPSMLQRDTVLSPDSDGQTLASSSMLDSHDHISQSQNASADASHIQSLSPVPEFNSGSQLQLPSHTGKPDLHTYQGYATVTESTNAVASELQDDESLQDTWPWASPTPAIRNRWYAVIVFVILSSAIAGVLGFGSGTLYVVVLMSLLDYDTKLGTGTGMLISVFLLGSLCISYVAQSLFDIHRIYGHLLVLVGFSVVGVFGGVYLSLSIKRVYILMYVVAVSLFAVAAATIVQEQLL
jgi:uncharacterized membrane protein YfcA